jgi:hypothetical protein
VEIVVGIVVCLHNFTSAAAAWIAILLRGRSERMSAGLAIGTLSRMQRRSFCRRYCAYFVHAEATFALIALHLPNHVSAFNVCSLTEAYDCDAFHAL